MKGAYITIIGREIERLIKVAESVDVSCYNLWTNYFKGEQQEAALDKLRQS